MSDKSREAYEKWLLNGNRFMTDPYSIFKAGMEAALACRDSLLDSEGTVHRVKKNGK